MRLNTLALGCLLPASAVLFGCGTGNMASPTAAVSTPKAITGKAFGGQLPVTGSLIALYAFGTGGYGSTGTLLATATTDSAGYFTIDPNSINCPTPSTPVYILSLGGNPGTRPNSAIALGSGLGACANAAQAFVTVNEISTAALAYTFSHFFSSTSSDGTTSDHFGAPADATQVITNANSGTLNTLLDVENGYPHPNTATFKFEGAKIISLGNILGACVNSAGPSSPSCSALFSYVKPANGSAPINTLEAAVDLALNPTQNTPYIFALQPQSGASAFTGGLTAAPADWTLSASYTSAAFGLGVNTRTASTIDVDTSGRVWFPSNGTGKAGVGYYDPSNGSFSQLFTAVLTHPQQVAIDVDNYVWTNDTATANIAGFPAATPSSPTLLALAGTTSTSVTVAYDNSLRYGVVDSNGLPALAQVNGKTSYTQVPNTEIANGNGFIASSLAADVTGGVAVAGQELRTPTTYDLYYYPNGNITAVTYQSFQDAGQVVFTGNNYVGTRGGYSPGTDGICIWASQTCFAMANDGVRHPSGLSLDGVGTLWLADNNEPGVEAIPVANGSYLNGSNQANNTVFLHDANNGGTLVAPTGIAVDRAGNVWVSNAGCFGDGCTPGSFTLSEIVGAGAPTITPVSRQVVISNLAGTEPQNKSAGGASR